MNELEQVLSEQFRYYDKNVIEKIITMKEELELRERYNKCLTEINNIQYEDGGLEFFSDFRFYHSRRLVCEDPNSQLKLFIYNMYYPSNGKLDIFREAEYYGDHGIDDLGLVDSEYEEIPFDD